MKKVIIAALLAFGSLSVYANLAEPTSITCEGHEKKCSKKKKKKKKKKCCKEGDKKCDKKESSEEAK